MQPYAAHLPSRKGGSTPTRKKPTNHATPSPAKKPEAVVVIRQPVTVTPPRQQQQVAKPAAEAKPRLRLPAPAPRQKQPGQGSVASPGPSRFARSLSAAVAGLDSAVSELKQARSKHSALDQPRAAADVVLDTQAAGLKVGCVKSALPSRVKFLDDAVVYMFEHPEHGHVDMHMYYRDFLEARCSKPDRALIFRVKNKLAYFANAYNPRQRGDVLRIEFANVADLALVEKSVLPRIRSFAKK